MTTPTTRHVGTRAAHIENAPAPQHSHPLSVPIYQTSNFAFDDPDALAESLESPDGDYVYSRYGNPTIRTLENTVAGLEGGVGAVATSSGMGAINSALLATLRAGDHVIAESSVYGGTYASLNGLAARHGIEVTYIPGDDPAEVTAALRPNTRVLYLETIGNATTKVVDLPAFARVAKAAGLVTIVDNTFATPILCRPLEHGADMVVHSVTKYLAGHSDVIGGILVFADADRYRSVWHHTMELGATADPFAAWLAIRGIQTLSVRLARQCANAAYLADQLAAHPAVEAVYWPGRTDHPDHAIARQHLDGFGGVLSFELKGGREAGHLLSKRVKLARLAVSLGGVATTLLHPASTTHRQLDSAALAAAGISESLVRIAVGIEEPEDLWADVAQAMPEA